MNLVFMVGFSHSNWERNPDGIPSTSSYAFNIGSRVRSWSSKKQPTISLLSTEDEYKAMPSGPCEAV